MPQLKYYDPSTSTYVPIDADGGTGWSTWQYAIDANTTMHDYEDSTHPVFAAEMSISGKSIALGTIAGDGTGAGVYQHVVWENPVIPTMPNNICVAADMNSTGILLKQPWLYLVRIRVIVTTPATPPCAVQFGVISFPEERMSTPTNGSTNEYHMNTTNWCQAEITVPFDATPDILPVRVGGRVRCNDSNAILNSMHMHISGPII